MTMIIIKLSNHSKKSILISRCFSSWKTLISWKTLLQMNSIKGYILPFHRLYFHRIPFYMSLSSLQTKNLLECLMTKSFFGNYDASWLNTKLYHWTFRDEKANGVIFDRMPFYSLPTLFEQSINHYFRSCTFAYWEFCLVTFRAVPNNRTAILVCPFWKDVDDLCQQTSTMLGLHPDHWF